MREATKILVVCGPTASGKTEIALELAKEFSGEIINADARQFYKGMDIGTNKISPNKTQSIPHHLFDITTPDKKLTVFDYQKLAHEKIREIAALGKLPILVGGTGLFIQAVVDKYDFGAKGRIFETRDGFEVLQLAPNVDRQVLYQKINERAQAMVRAGLEDEVRALVAKYGWDAHALTGIGYRQWKSYFDQAATQTETIEQIQKATRRYAKRQLTWFRADTRVQWIKNLEEARTLVARFCT